MITEKKTTRYEVNTRKYIEESFSEAYESSTDAPVVYPPSKAILITSIISILLISGMCVATYFVKNSIVWLIVGIVAFLAIFLLLYRHLKALKKYNAANSSGSQRFDFKSEYLSLFPQDLPDRMSATDLTREVAPMQNRQKQDVYNNAIRNLITALNRVNNPGDVLIKNINTYGEFFSQPRRRYYIKAEDGGFVIYDANFMEPSGEIVADADDVISFGASSEYDLQKYIKGSKVSQSAVVIALKTGEGADDVLYFEALGSDLERIKKLLGSKKEL